VIVATFSATKFQFGTFLPWFLRFDDIKTYLQKKITILLVFRTFSLPKRNFMHKIEIRNVFNLISVIWQCKNIFREELLLKITFSEKMYL
jgi:hypothetical protein